MIAAVLDEQNRVINRIVVDSLDVIPGLVDAAGCAMGDVYDHNAGTFSRPAPVVTREELKAAVTQKRWEIETGGIMLPGGIQINTTTADQNRITTVIANAQLGGVETVDFKAANGWVTLTLDQIKGLAGVIAQHVQACFSAERTHHEAIDELAPSELATYDINTGWPGA